MPSLSPESKLGLAATTGVLVYGVYQLQMPSHADIRTVESGNEDVANTERAATWMAAVGVAGLALLTKSSEVFVVGGVFIIGLAWSYRHADTVSPITKKATGLLTSADVAQAQMPEAAPATQSAPSYGAVI